jgi:hypothetical protein
VHVNLVSVVPVLPEALSEGLVYLFGHLCLCLVRVKADDLVSIVLDDLEVCANTHR